MAAYYAQLDADEYVSYLSGEGVGRWYGRGAAALGVVSGSPVTRDDLERLFRGFGPDGEPLVQNAGSERRRSGFELNFSFPKDVSALFALADDATRERIREILHRVVRHRLDYLQTHHARTRAGHDGVHGLPCDVVFAVFVHQTCREGTPLLHFHVVVPNVAVGPDGKTRAVDAGPLFGTQRLHSALLDLEASDTLRRELGIPVARNGYTFRVPAVPAELVTLWSPRSHQIARAVGDAGFASPRAKAKAARLTRRGKKRYDIRERTAFWAAQAGPLGEPVRALLARIPGHTPKAVDPAREAARAAELTREAALDLLRAQLTFTQAELLTRTAVLAIGREVGVGAVIDAVQAAVARPYDHHLEPMGVNSHKVPLFGYLDPPDPRPVTRVPARDPRPTPEPDPKPAPEASQGAVPPPAAEQPSQGHAPRPVAGAAAARVAGARTERANAARSHDGPARSDAPRTPARGEGAAPQAERPRPQQPGVFRTLMEWLAVRTAAKGLVDTLGRFTAPELEREVLRRAANDRVWHSSRTELAAAVGRFLKAPRRNGLVPLPRPRPGTEQAWTTRRHARLEQRLLREWKRLARTRGRGAKAGAVRAAGERLARFGPDARRAVTDIAARKGRLAVLDSNPGDARSAVLHGLKRAFERSKFDVRWAAPTGAAAAELGRDLRVESQTTRSLVARVGKGSAWRVLGAFLPYRYKGLRGKLKAAEAIRRPPAPLSKKSVVVVTHAESLGTREAATLLTLARKARAKVVLVGDSFHAPAGGAAAGLFRHLVGRGIAHTLSPAAPPSRPDLVAASELRKHRPHAAVQSLLEGGHLFAGDGLSAAVETLKGRYRAAGGPVEPHRHVIVTGTPEEARAFNAWVQAERRQSGSLGVASVRVPKGPKLSAGDRVVLTRSARPLEVRAGEAGTVVSVNPLRRTVTVARDSGREVTLPVRRYRHITLGYAAPLARAAAARVAHSYLLLRGYDPPQADPDQRSWRFSRQALAAALERAGVRAEVFSDRVAPALAQSLYRQGHKGFATRSGTATVNAHGAGAEPHPKPGLAPRDLEQQQQHQHQHQHR